MQKLVMSPSSSVMASPMAAKLCVAPLLARETLVFTCVVFGEMVGLSVSLPFPSTLT